jgi:ADP-heptose:LPS heptosyltransferase
LTSTSCSEIARRTLEECLAGRVPEFPAALAEDESGEALFGVLVEGLADRFEPALCEAYVKLFSQAIAQVAGLEAAWLQERYGRVRRARQWPAFRGAGPSACNGRALASVRGGEDPAVAGQEACSTVYVLSRVTLGADIAVTSVLMAAAKQRFPNAEIVFVGPRKNYGLFAGDPRIRHAEIRYQRGGLRQRLATWEDLKRLLADPDCLVIDPDSRLTQLGLLPVCDEDRYCFFESRAYGGASASALPELAAQWAAETLGVAGAEPYIALADPPAKGNRIAVSLGVGENPAKGLPDPFEEDLLRLLASAGAPLCIDKGAGGEEAARVERAAARSGAKAEFWEGSFAGFAGIIAGSRLYVGYDSAGQHVAAACGVPLVSVFAGFPAPRMFDRWRPAGERCHVIRVDEPRVDETLALVRDAVERSVGE